MAPPNGHGQESRLGALRSRSEFRGPVEPLGDYDATEHLALIYESRDQQLDAVIPFIEQGLERGERCLYIADELKRADIVDALRAAGIDVDSALEDGTLAVRSIADTYPLDGTFDPEGRLDFFTDTIADTVTEYEAFRVAAEMAPLVEDEAVVNEVIEYEARVNELHREMDAIGLCQYNRERVSEEVIRDVIKTHPHIIYNGTISQNVYYTSPVQGLNNEQGLTQDVAQMLETLLETTDAVTEREEHVEFLHRLNAITASPDRSFAEKLQAVFDLGCERFGLEFGVLARVDTDTDRFEIEYTNGDHDYFTPGTTLPLSETYCTAAAEHGRVASVVDPVESGYEDITVYQEFGLQAYLGTYVELDNSPNRTFFFVDAYPRTEPFSRDELVFHELVGRWVKYELEEKQRKAALERLNQSHELVQDLIRALIEEPTTSEIWQTVCDRLAASEIYEAAWIGEQPVSGQQITPDVWAGLDEESAQALTDDNTEHAGLARRVLDSRQPETVRVKDDPTVDLSHGQLREHGIESAMALPIAYHDRCYGILVVYADQPDAFDERHQSVLAEFGTSIGFAIAAVKRKEALITTEVIELEIQVSDPASVFAQVTDETESTLTLDGLTIQPDGSSLVYATATGTPVDSILEHASTHDRVEHVRLIEEYERDQKQEAFFEFNLTGTDVSETFAEYGAVVTAATATDGEMILTVELPHTEAVRAVVEAFQKSFPDSEVAAKRRRDRPIEIARRLQRDLGDQLTEKQHEVLRTAYLAGYFDQPRQMTGGELAETLGVSSSTFHQHLQAGLRKLLAVTFDDQSAP